MLFMIHNRWHQKRALEQRVTYEHRDSLQW